MKKSRKVELAGVAGLDNPDRLKYFGVIDKLRELGINEDLALPQIVVTGDQSSGKSSLLEGLTGLSFPVASDLCTRFATQIVLRRSSAQDSVQVSIIPGPSALSNETERDRLLKFNHELKEDEFSGEEFSRILDDAAEFMGLPRSGEDALEDLETRFSDHVLRIELAGPNHHHLSVVDVPGLFHNPTVFQTKEDLEIIRNLITDYITESRTIILAVMDARNNLANQEVFKMARAADPEGGRTVGVITKCDALQSGDEPGIIKIAQNSVEHLKHGWFAVRNRSTKEIKAGVTIEQRHENEKRFFKSAPWDALDKDKVGIGALKIFLGQLLYEHIRREFPSVVKEIERLYSEAQKQLQGLGAPRQTAMEQRQVLTGIATKYQRQVTDSLRGNYEASLDAQHPLKLRMHLHSLAEDFKDEITHFGHARVFRTVNGAEDNEFMRKLDHLDEDIYNWIRTIYRESRGAELPGTVNPAVLENMFRQQSAPWEEIASTYLVNAEAAVKAFNEAAYIKLVTDETMRDKIRARLDGNASYAMLQAMNHLQEVLSDERDGILQTVNHYFADTVQRIRQDRVLARLKAIGLQDGYQGISLQKITEAAHLSNEDQAVNDIHDVLKAYYQVAVKRFMDNVLKSVVERHLIGLDGPVMTFTPEYVGNLVDADLADLAAESYKTSSVRVDISQRATRLSEALKVAKSV